MTAEKFSNEDLRFQACLAFTLKYEGGRSNDPRDPGGRTMEGVTQATYDAYRAKMGQEQKNVYLMPSVERDEIYRAGYWKAVNGDILRAGEDLCVFDLAVNSGPARAKSFWARSGGARSPVDDVIHKICAARLSFLQALRTWSYFGAGWGRRVAACEALAIRMAHGESAPEALARKANEAKVRSSKKSTQAAAGGAIAGSATIAHALHGGMTGTTEIVVLAVIAGMIGWFLFHAWRQSQRADALGAAIAAIKVQREALEDKTKAAIAEAELAGKDVAKKAQELAAAQKTISDLGVRKVETKT